MVLKDKDLQYYISTAYTERNKILLDRRRIQNKFIFFPPLFFLPLNKSLVSSYCLKHRVYIP